jgi:hypothetical protein
MAFSDRYPRLFQFFAGYFHAYEDEPDEGTLALYRADCSAADIEGTLEELDLLLADPASWHEGIAVEANRYFATEAESRAWLLWLRKGLWE